MPRPIIRLGDTTSHGGNVTSAADQFKILGIPVARIGDTVACPHHGTVTIQTGDDDMNIEGRPVAREGDVTSCGASLVPSQNVACCK